MVSNGSSNKIKLRLRKSAILAIALVAIANLTFGNIAFAKKFTISDREVKILKEILDDSGSFLNLVLDYEVIKKALNTSVRVGNAATDITYGLLVLSAFSEMDLIDMVVTQRYKQLEREYFNQILDERLDLFSYWKGLGFDIPRVILGKINTPIAALSLNTFSISNEAIQIFVGFNVFITAKRYDGLWTYFQDRMSNESHEFAWKEAKVMMGGAVKETSFWGPVKISDDETSQLALQFATLWNNWGPYITPYGISEEAKKQFNQELGVLVIEAVKDYNLVQEAQKSLGAEKSPFSLAGLANGISERLNQLQSLVINSAQGLQENISEILANIIAILSRINPFGAGIAAIPAASDSQELSPIVSVSDSVNAEAAALQENLTAISAGITTEEIPLESQVTLDDIQKALDDISALIDLLNQQVADMIRPEDITESLSVTVGAEFPEQQEKDLQEQAQAITYQYPAGEIPVQICDIASAGPPARSTVIFNEIAWMGTFHSADDEWIELKNIYTSPINLSGWQILDKDRQIKIIFEQDHSISENSFYLLERTDDTTIADIVADLIYKGTLSNSDEVLYLFDENCRLQDMAEADPDWPAGDNSFKKTMERRDNLDWQTSLDIGGTPKVENSWQPIYSSAGGGAPPALESVPADVEPPTYPKMLISEVQIEGQTAKDEFVELYNPNNENVDLAGWALKRKTSGGAEQNLVSASAFYGAILAHAHFLIAPRPDDDGTLNYTGSTTPDIYYSGKTYSVADDNTILLYNPSGDLVDKVGFGAATDFEGSSFPENPPLGKSLGRKYSDTSQEYSDVNQNHQDFEIQAPTPKTRNQTPENMPGLPENPSEPEENTPSTGRVVINEIGWMGTKANSSDEWIELFNDSDTSIDLVGWKIIADDESPSITISTSSAATTTISARGFYLLERTDDNTISDIKADWFGSFGAGGLKNDGEKLELRDREDNLIDAVDGSEGWFAGKVSPDYVSMERIDPNSSGSDAGNWANNNCVPWEGWQGRDADGNRICGTPKNKNSVAKEFTVVSSGGFSIEGGESFLLTKLGSPYLVDGAIRVLLEAELTIEPGVIIKFRYSWYWPELKVEGVLNAVGGESQNEKIIFTSFYDDEFGGDTNADAADTLPSAGDWAGLNFVNSASNLKNVVVRYGGKLVGRPPETPPFTQGAVKVEGGTFTLEDSLIEKSQTWGLWLKDSSDSIVDSVEFRDADIALSQYAAVYIESQNPTIQNSTFMNNNIGILAIGESAPVIQNNHFQQNKIPIQISTLLPDISNNTLQDNNLNGIYLTGIGASDGGSILWRNAGSPYIAGALNLTAESVLEIESGVIVKFLSQGYIIIDGQFEAMGSPGSEIVFTSIYDDEFAGDTNNDGANTLPFPGHWYALRFSDQSSGSVLDNVIVRYGGYYRDGTNKGGAIQVDSARVAIHSAVLEHNLYCGVELNNALIELNNTIFRRNAVQYSNRGNYSSGLELHNSDPDFDNVIFEENYYGIYVGSGECPDLSGVRFGQGMSSNVVDIFPAECNLPR